MSDLSVWVCLSKANNVLVFSEEPELISGEWCGNLYVNSSMYNQIERMVKQSGMTHKSEPEQIVFNVKQAL